MNTETAINKTDSTEDLVQVIFREGSCEGEGDSIVEKICETGGF